MSLGITAKPIRSHLPSSPTPPVAAAETKETEPQIDLDDFMTDEYQKALPAYLREGLGEKKPLTLKGAGGKVPFQADAIFQGIKDKETRLKGKRWFKRDFTGVEVALPETIGQIANTMGSIANRAYQGMANEYGLGLYYSEAGELRATVQRGGWLKTSVNPAMKVEFPDGDSAFLLGILAHTHPFGAPTPSTGDHEHMAQMSKSPHTRLSAGVLAVPGGSWNLFDQSETIKGLSNSALGRLPLEAMFEPFWEQEKEVVLSYLLTGSPDQYPVIDITEEEAPLS